MLSKRTCSSRAWHCSAIQSTATTTTTTTTTTIIIVVVKVQLAESSLNIVCIINCPVVGDAGTRHR
jgi:hypothetical protein